MKRTIATMTGGVLLFAALGAAGEVKQTDWTAGGGVPGPVPAWSSAFETGQAVSWRGVPGQLALASVPLEALSRETVATDFDGALKVVAGDVNGDGADDVLAAAYYDETIALWVNLGGDPVQWRRHLVGDHIVQPVGIALADLDGDGQLDVIAGAGESGLILVWWNSGGEPESWVRQVVATGFIGAHDVAAADIDGDGLLDLVGAAWETDEVTWWRNGGGEPVEWIEHPIATGFDYACNLAVGDIDDDGDTDVVATAWHAAEVVCWINDGNDPITWVRQTVASGFTGAHWVDLADIDNDGRLDILGAAMNRAEVAWWRNPGGTPNTWTAHSITTSLAGAVSVEAADVNGDGLIDVLAAGWGADGVAWWQNDNNGDSWTRHDVDRDFDEASSVHPADVNGDGAIDMLSTSWALAEVAWWRLSDFESQGTLTSSILDAGARRNWQKCMVEAELPERSALTIEVRGANDWQNMDVWSFVDPEGGLPGFITPVRYIQYRFHLTTTDSTASPIVRSITFTWTDALSDPREAEGRAGSP